jgi:UDPglucose--hexose-1-phosphate uridylyltransferase
MSELRYNLVSGEWVVVATERAKRPKDFLKVKEKKELPAYKEGCPFCPGNESLSPPESARIGDELSWKVRTVPNLFGALSMKSEHGRKLDGICLSMGGFGNAEVIIEHPQHNICIPLMKDEEVADIIRMYKERYIAMTRVEGIEAVIIFKNHGPMAGTSLEHPHSQLIATPIVPPQVRGRVEKAVHYFDMTGSCVFCKTLEEELKTKKRVVLETDKFVAFLPYAGASPFTIWIFPRRHMAYFAHITEDEIADLAINLKTVLAKLYRGLDNPDFNYTIRSIPVRERGTEYFHWYITIIPRLTQPAGFELGSGMFINTSLPEEAAEFLRNTKCQ